MHATGRLFPRADRAPSIEPVSPERLARHLKEAGLTQEWLVGRSHRVDVGFYKSHAIELTRRLAAQSAMQGLASRASATAGSPLLMPRRQICH